ncbi:MAG: ABC transporter substrate-binding protein [Deltaproteobacteria bacterium]|nr:ABC transporter substrate-binding protein [Deltaproteobacteria bacterium]
MAKPRDVEPCFRCRTAVKLKAASLIFFLCLGVANCVAAQDKVIVATLRSVSQWSLWTALESGFYKELGIEVLPVTFTGGTQTITSLVSGDVQITTTGGSTAINAALKGGDVKLISTTLGIFPYTLYVSPRIHSAADLKGKKIGILSFGGTAYPATRYALQHLGLNPDADVTFIQTGDQIARFGALASGSIDGTLLQPPDTIKAKELGFKPMVNLAQSGIKFPMNHNSTSARYIKTNRDKVKKFMIGYIGGLARLKTDREFAIQVLGKYLRNKDQTVLNETYDFWSALYPAKPYVEREQIENYLVTLKDRGSAKAEDFMDNSILAELEREGFIAAAYKRYQK